MGWKPPPPNFRNDTVISYELLLKCVHSHPRNMSEEKSLWLFEQKCVSSQFAYIFQPLGFIWQGRLLETIIRLNVALPTLLFSGNSYFPLDLTVLPTPYQLTLGLSVFIAHRSSKRSNCSAQKNERCKHRVWKFHWWQNVLRFSSRCARSLRCGEFKRRHVDQCRILWPLPRSRAQDKEQDRVAWGELVGAIR